MEVIKIKLKLSDLGAIDQDCELIWNDMNTS